MITLSIYMETIMDINRAKEIIEVLAEGVDPTTGEVLPDDNVCNKGEVVRAFYSIIAELNKKQKKNMPENAGKPWTKDDDVLLTQLYKEGLTIRRIASKLGRSLGSIRSRIDKMGLN